jgi:hypothetical protein
VILGCKVLDKDIELLKISLLDGYIQANVNAMYSFVLGAFIGLMVAILSLYYEGTFKALAGQLVGSIAFFLALALIFVGGFYMINEVKGSQQRYLNAEFELIKMVETGKPLPSLEEMKKILSKRKKK